MNYPTHKKNTRKQTANRSKAFNKKHVSHTHHIHTTYIQYLALHASLEPLALEALHHPRGGVVAVRHAPATVLRLDKNKVMGVGEVSYVCAANRMHNLPFRRFSTLLRTHLRHCNKTTNIASVNCNQQIRNKKQAELMLAPLYAQINPHSQTLIS